MSQELITFTDEQKKIIKNQFFPQGTSTNEMVYCMNIAKSLGLNPITKEIFFIERSHFEDGKYIKKTEPMLGRDSYIKVAHSTGLFGGIETSSKVEKVPTLIDGEWQEKDDLTATCKVYRKDIERPFVTTVQYSEYVQRKKNGEITKFWKEKPDTMLKKVAESQALRKAFNINGAYAIEEVNDVEYTDETQRKQTQQIEVQDEPDYNDIIETEEQPAYMQTSYDDKQIEVNFETIDAD